MSGRRFAKPAEYDVLDLPRGTRSGLVDIVSGSFGAGHDAAAREIASRFEARGYSTRTWDVVDFFPWRLGELLRRMYFLQLRSVPGTWESLLHRLEPGHTLHGAVVRALAMTADPLLSIATRSEVIISTHPFASQALGHLRESGRLDVPVVTYLTDMSVHPLWVHPAVDLHLALHEIPAAQARLRQVTTRVIEPLVPIDFARRPADVSAQRELRARLGLPPDKPLALVTGGSLGVGEMSRSARDIARTGLATPVVLCGENRSLYHRLGADQLDVVRLGWRDDVPDLLRSVNCVVQNAGGFTSLEAIAAGTPALSYRCIPGHGRTNAQALHDAGLIPWAKDERELHRELQSALTRVVPAHHSGPGPMADIVDAVFPERIDVPA